jgi:adenylate kinase family enzyme
MSKSHGIIIFGANGSSKSTLGCELARLLNFKFMDIEDYCFEKSEISHTKSRSREDYLEVMLSDIEKYRSFVISTVIGDIAETLAEKKMDSAILKKTALFRNVAILLFTTISFPKKINRKNIAGRALAAAY